MTINELLPPYVSIGTKKTLHSKGLFAEKTFEKGAFIGFFTGQEIRNRTEMSLQSGKDCHVEPSLDTPFRYLNHSCEANAYFLGRNLHAWSTIQEGEEITIDYNCSESELFSPFECNCKTLGCLGRIEGFDSLSRDQKMIRQEKIADWIKERDNNKNGSE